MLWSSALSYLSWMHITMLHGPGKYWTKYQQQPNHYSTEFVALFYVLWRGGIIRMLHSLCNLKPPSQLASLPVEIAAAMANYLVHKLSRSLTRAWGACGAADPCYIIYCLQFHRNHWKLGYKAPSRLRSAARIHGWKERISSHKNISQRNCNLWSW